MSFRFFFTVIFEYIFDSFHTCLQSPYLLYLFILINSQSRIYNRELKMRRENDQNADYPANIFFDEFLDQRQKRAGGGKRSRGGEEGGAGAAARVPNPAG